jgi:hypothetical protein
MLKLNTVKQDGTHNTKSVCYLSTDKKNTRETGNVIQVVRGYKTLGSYRRIYVCEAESIRPYPSGEKRKATRFDRFSYRPLTQSNLQGEQFIFDVLKMPRS